MGTGLETKVAFGDMMQAFEAFKDANDERLGEIEKRIDQYAANPHSDPVRIAAE